MSVWRPKVRFLEILKLLLLAMIFSIATSSLQITRWVLGIPFVSAVLLLWIGRRYYWMRLLASAICIFIIAGSMREFKGILLCVCIAFAASLKGRY